MRAVGELVLGGFRRWARYRVATLTALVANTVFGLIRASLVTGTVRAAGGEVNGYTAAAATTYVWVTQAMLGPIELWGQFPREVGQRIKSGDLAVDLLRPAHPLLQWWATDLGRAASQLLPRFVPMLVIGALTTGLVLPRNPLVWLAFLVSMVLANTLCLLCWLTINLLGLWLVDIRGFLVFFMVVFNTLSGFLVPVQWFPSWLRTFVDHTFLPSMWQTPADLATGLAAGNELQVLAVQAGWVVALTVLVALVLRAGTRHLEVQGG
ncbi:ABC transporter permease [Aestuariimicrobium soli]|uniref:ABC transporter permease n=1 Tax=Aestuariimicrobium soli TaxID=2035834 RepID=UPI003EC01F25